MHRSLRECIPKHGEHGISLQYKNRNPSSATIQRMDIGRCPHETCKVYRTRKRKSNEKKESKERVHIRPLFNRRKLNIL